MPSMTLPKTGCLDWPPENLVVVRWVRVRVRVRVRVQVLLRLPRLLLLPLLSYCYSYCHCCCCCYCGHAPVEVGVVGNVEEEL